MILEQKRTVRIYTFGIAFLLFFIVIIFLMFQLQKSKSQKREVDNQLLIKKLEEKNKELTNKSLQILQTSEMLESTHKELIGLKLDHQNNNSKRILSRIITDLKKGSQVFNKEEFEKLYLEIEGDFYKRLLEKFPDLSKNELRLCAFLRLNLSSKEIASITQKSPQTITVARHRLRKKIGLSEQQNLVNFLISF
ncbi:hypothetical protein IF128_02065 [Empedobacter stercoris]|uniref:HTH luxR-type domain-containing protein n=1 Tax=Empedobacter stercoris TaxID=1628248 RepID=A0ABX1WLB8_9FLAO|nr:hypothetical protein [Empedobacter stercoris]MCA4808546.1 hypothetical protein [Empedobacter stercoris]NOJ75299.1 hypothetical protein [Empedobacter stercoris]QNT13570.1 hypothetical protein HNV03_02135 [Empedobacter stercoris]